ncbi:hypothetical protein BJ742DRAFT_789751 [Cladochytrium replicatum]|nr:hypothetical protein BJ742DRAFT_789751 [Cladochytrium replicatum]
MSAPTILDNDKSNGSLFNLNPASNITASNAMTSSLNMIDGTALFSVLSAAFVTDPHPTTLALLQYVGGLLQQSRTNQNNFLEHKIDPTSPLKSGQPLQLFGTQPSSIPSLANNNADHTASGETVTHLNFNFSSANFSDQTAMMSGGWFDTTGVEEQIDFNLDAQLMGSILMSMNEKSKDSLSASTCEVPMIASTPGESSSMTSGAAEFDSSLGSQLCFDHSTTGSSEHDYQFAGSADPADFGWLEEITALANAKLGNEGDNSLSLQLTSEREIGDELDWGILQLMMGPLVDQTFGLVLNNGVAPISSSLPRDDNAAGDGVVGSVDRPSHPADALETLPMSAMKEADVSVSNSVDDNVIAKNRRLPTTNPEISNKRGFVKFGSRPEIDSLYDEYSNAVEAPEQAMPPSKKGSWSYGAEYDLKFFSGQYNDNEICRGGFTVDQLNMLRKQLDQYFN